MRGCDLTSGLHKLQLSFRALQHAWQETGPAWRDAQRRQFDATYLVPLEPEVRLAVAAIERLEQVLAEAYRQCDP
ncbi:MAG: hypothetical protein A2W31_00720 [Planctomycetes bacterium RBG_16_64_10]|nr:MAG: hypothetical protein A2W31_00720 [Planctomycetes bacterium RBG_16_64_10]